MAWKIVDPLPVFLHGEKFTDPNFSCRRRITDEQALRVKGIETPAQLVKLGYKDAEEMALKPVHQR